MYKIEKLILQYHKDIFRNELDVQREETLEDMMYYAQDKNRHIEEVM